MFSFDGITAPVWGDRDSQLAFLVEALKRWADAAKNYSGKSEAPNAKTEKKLEAIKEQSPETVTMVSEVMSEIRSLILSTVESDPVSTHLLFTELDEVKKAVGSWRADVRIIVEDDGEDDNDRDLIAEYEALNNARTAITGMLDQNIAMGVLSIKDLPEGFRKNRQERVDGKNVDVPGEYIINFPGKINSPTSEGSTTKNGRTAVSMAFNWSLPDLNIGKASLVYLARVCSTPEVILHLDDVKTSLDAKYGDWGGKDEVQINTPRGVLTGVKVKK